MSQAENHHSAEEWTEQGIQYHNDSEYDEAVRCFTEAIRLNPKYADAYHNRGKTYAETGKSTEALRDYNSSIHCVWDNPAYYNSRGTLYVQLRKHKFATEDFKEALDLDRDSVDAYVGLGQVALLRGEKHHAVNWFTKAIELAPSSEYYVKRAQSYWTAQIDLVEADLLQAIELDPKNQEALAMLEQFRNPKEEPLEELETKGCWQFIVNYVFPNRHRR